MKKKIKNLLWLLSRPFGWKRLFICSIFGHSLNENPVHTWCGRCGLIVIGKYGILTHKETSDD